MDINDLRSVFTVLAILMFVGIVWWAYSDRRQQAYDEAAMLPLEDDAPSPVADVSQAVWAVAVGRHQASRVLSRLRGHRDLLGIAGGRSPRKKTC